MYSNAIANVNSTKIEMPSAFDESEKRRLGGLFLGELACTRDVTFVGANNGNGRIALLNLRHAIDSLFSSLGQKTKSHTARLPEITRVHSGMSNPPQAPLPANTPAGCDLRRIYHTTCPQKATWVILSPRYSFWLRVVTHLPLLRENSCSEVAAPVLPFLAPAYKRHPFHAMLACTRCPV
jgi:hypothetical protein